MTTAENLKRILTLLRPYRGKQIQTLCSMVMSIVLSLLIPLVLRFLIDEVIGKRQPGLLVPLVLAALSIFVASAAFNFLTSYLFNVIGQSIVRDVRRRLFAHITDLPFGFLTAQGTGRIMARVLDDVSTVGRVVSAILVDFLIHSCTLVAVFGILVYFNWRLALLGFVPVPLYVLVVRHFNMRLRRTSYLAMARHAEVSSSLQESIAGMREIRSFCRERTQIHKFTQRLNDFLNARVWLGVLSNSSIQMGFIVSSLGSLLILWYGGSIVLRGALSLGTLMAFWAYLGQLYTPINTLMSVNVQFQEVAAAFRRIDEILLVRPTIEDRAGAQDVGAVKGEVEFSDVTFSYDGKRSVLDRVSFRIGPGERVAIVGRSGSGKTTIVNLICRFFDPQSGSVRLDGKDLRDLRIADLRGAVALVSQDTFLFNASVRENIEFGREGATDNDLADAASLAGVADFAAGLPQGLDSVVGERGVSLSGGERQRIALARALLRDPKVLVLDEATSQLDSRAERQLKDALDKAMAGRTSIMIAHRLSTVSGAERILVLDDSRIVEQGTHETLIDKRGVYYSLYEEQARLREAA